ncbi:MAG: hypothetical protein GX605_10465, partial [Chloroflexi bacterium]|nr:hypothetical protein [Chloroflexota bacterium]
AAVASLQAGDMVLAVDGRPVSSSSDLQAYIQARPEQELRFEVQREVGAGEAQRLTVAVTPSRTAEDRGQIGVHLQSSYSWPEAFVSGLRTTTNVVFLTVALPVSLLRGDLALSDARPVGPVGIAQLAGGAAQFSLDTGWWYPIFLIMGFISTALAITNLLPLPALDGGRIFFLLVEAVRGRRVDPEKEALVHMIGMVMLVGLMVLITYQDIVSPIPQLDWSQFF